MCGPVLLVLQQLTVPTGQSVTGLTEKLQWLLLVDGTENRPLSGRTNRLYRHTGEKTPLMLNWRDRNQLRGNLVIKTSEGKTEQKKDKNRKQKRQLRFINRHKRSQKTLARASGCMVPQLEVPSKQPDSAALLLWQQPISTTTFTVLQLGSVLFRLLQFLASINIGQPFTVRVSHLTRGSVSILLCVDLVVLGNFDPLVGLHAGLTQPFSALHTKAYGSCVVLAACAHLEKITRISI